MSEIRRKEIETKRAKLEELRKARAVRLKRDTPDQRHGTPEVGTLYSKTKESLNRVSDPLLPSKRC